MANNNDELTLKLKVDSAKGNKKLEDTSTQLKKIKKNSDENNKTFGIGDTKIGKMFQSFQAGAKVGVNSMKTLRGAIATTGIGLLILAVTSLIKYFKGTEEGAAKLKEIMTTVGAVINIVTETFIKLGKAIFDAFSNPKEAIKELWEIIKTNIVNRVKGIADVYINLFKILKNGFKGVGKAIQAAFTIDPEKKKKLKEESKELFTEVGQNAKDMGESVIQSLTGVDNLIGKTIDKVKEFAGEIKEGAKIANELAKRQTKLDEEVLKNIKIEAELRKELAQVKLEMDDATKSEQEKLELLNKATDLQNQITDKKIKLGKEQLEITSGLNALSSNSIDATKEQLELEASLIDLETERAERNKEFADKRTAIEEKEKEAILEKLEDTKRLQEELALIKLEGRELELEANEIWYETELEQIGDNDEAKLLLKEIYDEKIIKTNEKFDVKDKAIKDKKATEDIRRANQVANAKKATEDIMIGNAIRFAGILQQLAGENEDLAIAGLLIEKGLAVAEVTINTIRAASSAIAEYPGPVGIAYAVALGIAGALSVAEVIATASQGVSDIKSSKRDGGWLVGNSHANGGILLGDVEAENEEFIVNARTMRNPAMAQQVMKLNAAGNAGFDATMNNSVSPEEVAEIVAATLVAIPIVVSENQITEAQKNVIVREDKFTIN